MITQKLIKEVKKHTLKTHHDQNWHDYNNRSEVIAVIYALTVHPFETIQEQVKRAKMFLEEINK